MRGFRLKEENYEREEKEAYFYDNPYLAVSEDNPYFDKIVTAVQELSELETIEPTSWCQSTWFSLVTKDNVRFEIFYGMDDFILYGIMKVENEKL